MLSLSCLREQVSCVRCIMTMFAVTIKVSRGDDAVALATWVHVNLCCGSLCVLWGPRWNPPRTFPLLLAKRWWRAERMLGHMYARRWERRWLLNFLFPVSSSQLVFVCAHVCERNICPNPFLHSHIFRPIHVCKREGEKRAEMVQHFNMNQCIFLQV